MVSKVVVANHKVVAVNHNKGSQVLICPIMVPMVIVVPMVVVSLMAMVIHLVIVPNLHKEVIEYLLLNLNFIMM